MKEYVAALLTLSSVNVLLECLTALLEYIDLRVKK